MADSASSFDVVVIGAGHNGLTCAAYLARAGLSVGVVEGGDEIGGGTATRELTLPGFRHNTCANYFHGFDASPIHRDLELSRYGFEFLLPEVQQAYVYGDDRALVLHRDLEPTLESVGRFSGRDAATWGTLTKRYAPARALLVATQFNPPSDGPALAAAALAEGMVAHAVSDELVALAKQRPYDVIDQQFESERLRVLFKKLIHVIQATNSEGFGALVPGLLMNLTRTCLARGGAQTLPDALAAVVREAGGTILTGDPVERIVVTKGAARAVRLASGVEIDAAEAVVSAVNFPQLVEMVGADNFSASVRDKAAGWDWLGGGSLVTLHLALHDAPDYRASEYDPDVAKAFNVSFGADDSEEFHRSLDELEAGSFPDTPVGNGACDTVHDPSYVDGDGHVAFWWPFAPYAVDGDAANWERRRDSYSQRLLDVWRRYAPNLDEANTLATYLRTPLEVERENATMRFGAVRTGPYIADQTGANRPHPDLADYRVPAVAGLYHCGASSPNGGGVNGAAGYCAAGVIAGDLAVERWWPAMTLAYARELAGT